MGRSFNQACRRGIERSYTGRTGGSLPGGAAVDLCDSLRGASLPIGRL
jgi:hypothetical protein